MNGFLNLTSIVENRRLKLYLYSRNRMLEFLNVCHQQRTAYTALLEVLTGLKKKFVELHNEKRI